jgi:DivIVA domain-containing protein
MAYGPPAAQRPTQRVTANDVRAVRFGKPPFGKRGYDEMEVDDFLRLIADTLAMAPGGTRVSSVQVNQVAFRKPRIGSRGYDEDEVDAFLDAVEAELRWRETPEGQREIAAETAAAATGGGGRRSVRAVAVVVIWDRGRLLAAELTDSATGRTVYRPPGGEIAFGERGQETVLRAFREEFGAGLTDVRPLATLESIFRIGGQDGHELVLVYEAAPVDPALWTQQRLLGHGPGGPTSAVWVPIDVFRRRDAVLLPEGMLALLDTLPG